jgi:predicted TIM-barrel fold metal-dependent hydrolase
MELPSSDKFYSMSVESMDTSKLLKNASKQRDARKLDTFPIIDCDSHHYESESAAEIIEFLDDPVIKQLAESEKSRGKPAGIFGGGRIGYQDRGGRITRYPLRRTELTPGDEQHRQVHITHRWMDAMGVDYTCLFPGPMLGLGLHPEPEIEYRLSKAYNRWLVETVLPNSPRIKALICLPFNHHRGAYEIIEEFGGHKDVAGFCVASVRDTPVHSDDLMKCYSLMEEIGKPLSFHSGTNWGGSHLKHSSRFIAVHSLSFPWYVMVHVANWITNGLNERFPKLKVVWAEGGLAWIPFLMQRLDHEYMMRTSEAAGLKKLPSEYMKDMYYSSQPCEKMHPEALEKTFEMIDAENTLLYASDYPHWDMDVPSVIYDLPFLDEKQKRKILGENSRHVFDIDYSPLYPDYKALS